MADEIHWWSATRLAAAIAAAEVGSREALEHLVSRIEALDTDVNAVVHWDLERARAAADAADANDDADSLSLSSRVTSLSASQRSSGRGGGGSGEKCVALVAHGIASVGE